MIKIIFKDLFQFIKRPNDQQIILANNEKLKYLLILLSFELIITFLVIFPLNIGIDALLKIKYERFDYSGTILYAFLLWIIIVPFFEELIFRYILRYQGLKKKFIKKSKWNTIFPFLVYMLAISFGFIHLSNYLNDNKLFLLLSPFIVLSQLLGGLIITFIRVRINFLWGVFYHWTWNFLFVIAIPILGQQFSKQFIEQTTNYNISISEQSFFNKEKDQVLKVDSLNNKFHKIEIKQFSLQHILDTLYFKDKYYVDDVLINLNYNSKKGMTKDEFLELLRKEYEIE